MAPATAGLVAYSFQFIPSQASTSPESMDSFQRNARTGASHTQCCNARPTSRRTQPHRTHSTRSRLCPRLNMESLIAATETLTRPVAQPARSIRSQAYSTCARRFGRLMPKLRSGCQRSADLWRNLYRAPVHPTGRS